MTLEAEQNIKAALEKQGFIRVDGTDKDRPAYFSDNDLVCIVSMVTNGRSFDEIAIKLDCLSESVRRKWKRRHEWQGRILPLMADRAERRFEEVKRDFLHVASPRVSSPKMADILQAVSMVFGIPAREICSTRRQAYLVRARHVYFAVCRRLTGQSFPAIGRSCGNRDHSTAQHGIQRVEANLSAYDPEYSRVMSMFEAMQKAA